MTGTTAANSMNAKVNLTEALASFDELWDPRIAARVNDYAVKVVHIQGDFSWHSHIDTDELFMVIKGQCEIAMRDRTVVLNEGDIYVVSKGVEHKPSSAAGCDLLLLEPADTPNTGDNNEGIPEGIAVTTGKELR